MIRLSARRLATCLALLAGASGPAPASAESARPAQRSVPAAAKGPAVKGTTVKGAAVKGKGLNTRVGPGRGSGQRRLVDAISDAARAAGAARTHRVGKPPKEPSPTLPPDIARGEPSDRARRSIARGATTTDLVLGTDDPELRALRDAERALFPRGPENADSRFGMSLPVSLAPEGPALSASGLPLSALGTSGRGGVESPSNAWPSGMVLPNLPVVFEQRTLSYLKFYRDTERGRAITQVWARKLGRYSAAIEAELARAGLPTDLLWLSLIESGHNPTIRSPVGAAGLWQFMPESARLYGLTVDRWVDERLDPLRSTQAAIRYLSDLKLRFGTWELAMAAYNMGHFGLSRVISKYNSNDYWRLSRLEAALPWETVLYVPKVIAVALVMRNKQLFYVGDVQPDPAVSFDTVLVPAGVPLENVAAQAGVATEAIESLNPQYLAGRTPPAESEPDKHLWAVHVPYGSGIAVARYFTQYAPGARQRVQRVRWGDTWETVAFRARCGDEELRAVNRARAEETLRAGALVLLPEGAGSGRPPADAEDVIVVPPERFRYPGLERVFYRVVVGDELDTLANALGVQVENLVVWNGLDARANLQPGMLLTVYVPRGAELGRVRVAREQDAGKRLLAGSTSFIAHFEGEQGRERLELRAREGETLVSIGRRYGLSGGMMERINHFSRWDLLAEGAPVVVYAKNGPQPREIMVSRAPDPLPPLDPPHPTALPMLPQAAAE